MTNYGNLHTICWPYLRISQALIEGLVMIRGLPSSSVSSRFCIADSHLFEPREFWASLKVMGSSGSLIGIEMRAEFA